jgi:hypothetical protein
VQGEALWSVAALDYELGYLLEPKSAPPGWQAGEQILARFWRFDGRQSLSRDEADAWLARHAGTAGVGGLQPAIAEGAYNATVARIKSLIFAGDCYQVNFTFPLEFSNGLVRRWRSTRGCASASRCAMAALSAMHGRAASFRCRRNCSSSGRASAW